MLSDIFIATEEQVRHLCIHDYPLNFHPGIYAKGVDPVKIVALRYLLIGEAFDKDWTDNIEKVREYSSDGPWILRFPQDLLDALEQCEDNRLHTIALKWMLSSAIHLDGWKEDDTTTLVKDVASLARQAKSNAMGLYIWISL